MGYYYTTSPENAVPGKSWGMPKTHVPASPVKERGYRYYSAETGRWAGRDPIGERGGENLFVFVRNAVISERDFLGLTNDPGDFGWPSVPCCNGVIYNEATHCCCKGKVVERKKIPTGIVYHETDNVSMPGTPQNHWWLGWPGGSADANAPGNIGKIGVPAFYPGPDVSPPTNVELSPCEYDFDAIMKCLADATAGKNGQMTSKKCLAYIQGLVGGCMVGGCTAK